MSVSESIATTTVAEDDAYAAAGYGERPVGFGKRPAVVVVDFQLAFTDPSSRTGRSAHIAEAVNRAGKFLGEARALGLPVIHTAVEFASTAEVGYWKTRTLEEVTPDSPYAQIDPRVWADGDELVKKRFPSAFFGTEVASMLRYFDADTVLLMGCTTSGCVRASVIDSFSYGFRTIVVDDCCGDQDAGAHDANMRDVDRRYADVMTSEDVLATVRALH